MNLWPTRWKSLSSEIILVYASLSILLVALLSYIGYRMNSRVLEENIRRELLLTVDQTMQQINAELEARIREVQTLTLVPTLRHAAEEATSATERLGLQDAADAVVAAKAPGRARREVTAPAEAFLVDLLQSHPHIAEAFVTDRYGINAAASNPTTDLRQKDEAWWQEAVQHRYHLGNLEFDDSAAAYAYSIALPISDNPRTPIGVVKAVFNLTVIQNIVNEVRVGDAGYLAVIARDGTIISHPRHESLFRRIEQVSDLAPVSGVFAASPRGVATFTRDPNAGGGVGDEWLVGYSRIMRPASLGPLDWTVAAFVSRSEVVAPIITVRNRALLAGALFILAAVPVVIAISKRLSRPLCDLAARADRIGQGDFDVALEVPSSNEIGRLASTLSAMVENLKTSHRRTLEINLNLERTVRERTEELRRKNRQIEEQSKRVMEASRLKSQFLANMSHELRTPLNAVLALSEILGNEMSGPLNEEQAKQVGIINRAGKSLLRLINDVLDLSKIEAGRMTVERAAMSLKGLVQLVADTLRPLAEDKNLGLTVDAAPDLPEFISSDEQKLRQVLINLMGNGIKFTERGGVTLEVRRLETPNRIQFRIIDTGIGIDADATERIFEEFHQADGSTTRKYGGTGLGLTISRRMAELMGGTLTVDSAPAKGSTFSLIVPFEMASPVPEAPTETLRRVRLQVPEPSLINTADDSSTSQNDSRPLVLVAEDEHDNLYIMKKYLNRLGCRVIFARDGSEVFAKARELRPIAITLDLVLPRKNGWEVLAELKADSETSGIPVIIASVLDNEERAFCLGAFRYLVKPINETDLGDAIHQILWTERKDRKRILIIDDSVVDSDLTTRLLTENKYEVSRAPGGDEGLAMASGETPDLILLDLNMPGKNGFQVLTDLKANERTNRIPVAVYTARDLLPEEESRIRRHAAKVFLKNPLEPNRMLSDIAEMLSAAPTSSADGGEETRGASLSNASIVAEQEQGAASEDDMMTILIVEDDPANQYTLEVMLKSEGYQVLVACNGREGIEKALSLQPDLILMDMMMPVMGGHEATRTLKDNPEASDIPVIALTAAAMAGDREKALAAGCDDYISKPVDRPHLIERIEHWLGPDAGPGATEAPAIPPRDGEPAASD